VPPALRRAAFLVATLFATPVLAQDRSADAGGDFVMAGAAGVVLPQYEGSGDTSITPAPGAIGRVSGFAFQFIGNRLSVDLVRDSGGPGWDIQAGPSLVLDFNRTSADSIDDPRVAALPERNTGIELGGYVGVARVGVVTSDYDRLSVTLSYRYDVNGAHESGILSPSVSYMTPLSRKAAVAVFASAERAENGYADAYFSVTPADAAASGLPAYDADGGWKNWGIGAGTAVSLTGDLTGGLQLVAGGMYRRLVNDFADSPVTRAGSRDQWMGAIGLAYSF